MTEPLLAMEGMVKTFGNTQALDRAEFRLEQGEVHALLGVNGAGKSTLIKILSGVYRQDEGTIRLSGEETALKSPKEAKEEGIHTVYQEVDTAIVAELSVAENIMLDTFTSGGLFVSRQKLVTRAEAVLKELDAEGIDVRDPAFKLTLAEKQLVLIARALVHSARLIIFDEPTAPLSLHESEKLFAVIRKLKSEGVGCVFISHRLPEVFEISDRITVMREGRTVDTFRTDRANPETVIEAMLGAVLHQEDDRERRTAGETLLEVEELSDGDKLKGVSFKAEAGEIVGIVGLVGAGKTELAKTLFGRTPAVRGTVTLGGQPLDIRHPKDAIRSGLALVPEERRKEGLFVHESLATNASFPNLKRFSPRLFMDRSAEKRFTEDIIGRLGIKAGGPNTLLEQLSGGNQQKVAIGKWMSLGSKLFLFDEPTKGVDIGAKNDIYREIREIAAAGAACLYFTSEMQEALLIADRIYVMYNGLIVKEFSREEATQERILLYASGGEETRTG